MTTLFEPTSWWNSPHLQTIGGAFWPYVPAPEQTEFKVSLGDGDVLTALETRTQQPPDTIILAVHGLTGSADSAYCARLSKQAASQGIKTVALNLRGCGSGAELARKIYHSGCSDDVARALTVVTERFPGAGIHLVGYSLGGNIVLKLAGEMGNALPCASVTSVCPPIELLKSAKKLGNNLVYERYFVWRLHQEVQRRCALLGTTPPQQLPWSLVAFDDVYTSKQAGFRDAMHYYETCSSRWFLPDVRIPTRILVAEDDPLIDCSWSDHSIETDSIKVTRSTHGGHLGFVTNFHRKDWLERWILSGLS